MLSRVRECPTCAPPDLCSPNEFSCHAECKRLYCLGSIQSTGTVGYADLWHAGPEAYQKSRFGKEKRAFRVVSRGRAGTAAHPPAAGTFRNQPDVCSRAAG